MLRKRFAVIAVALAVMIAPSELCASDVYDYEPTFSPYYAGSVKSSVLYDALAELNYIRWLIGVPNNVTLNTEYTRKAQHGAVLLDALNTLTHTPGRPSDMDTSFYELGYDATSHGNIAVAQIHQGSQVYGNMSISYSTKLYMHDSDNYNIPRLGHRRWLMNPRLKQTGFGLSTRRGYAVTYVVEEFEHSGEGNTLTQEEYARYLEWLKWPISDEYITWPTNKHPHPLTYFEADTAWSVTLNSDVYDECNASAVRVSLTRLADNATWNFSASGNDGYFNVADSSRAYDECIIFRPEGISAYNDGGLWRVEISGLTRKDGGTGNISYTVQFTGTATGYEENETYTPQEDTPQDDTDNDKGKAITFPNNDTNQNTNQNQTEQNTNQNTNQNQTERNTNQNTNQNQNQTSTNSNNDSDSGGGCTSFNAVAFIVLIFGIPRKKK